MRKLVDKEIVDIPLEEQHLYSSRVKMFGGELVNLTLEEASEIEAEEILFLSNIQENKYKKEREAAYLPIKDQLDMLYWDMKNGTTTFIQHRDAVKAAYPKPV